MSQNTVADSSSHKSPSLTGGCRGKVEGVCLSKLVNHSEQLELSIIFKCPEERSRGHLLDSSLFAFRAKTQARDEWILSPVWATTTQGLEAEKQAEAPDRQDRVY